MGVSVTLKFSRFLLMGSWPEGPLGGLVLTIVLSLLGGVLSFVISVVGGLCRTSENSALRFLSTVYVELVRGVPFIMVLFWFYFLLPKVIHVPISEFNGALIAVVFFFGAYGTEIVKAGIESVPKGQIEAGLSTGFTKAQVTYYIVLPQALRNMIPSFVNHFVSLLKDTSLVYFTGVTELTGASYQVIRSRPGSTIEVFVILFAVYLLLCSVLNKVSDSLERRTAIYAKSV